MRVTIWSVRARSERRRLHRHGEVVPLPPKAFDTLVALVRRAGRLWKARADEGALDDTFVEESISRSSLYATAAAGEQPDGRPYKPSRRVGTSLPQQEEAGCRVRLHSRSGSRKVSRQVSIRLVHHRGVRQSRGNCMTLLARHGLCGGYEPAPIHRAPLTLAGALGAILPFRELGAQKRTSGACMADALITLWLLFTASRFAPPSSFGMQTRDPVRGRPASSRLARARRRIQRAGERVRVTAQLLRVGDGSR